MSLSWETQYQLGIKVIDEQHKAFIDALNELINSLNSTSGYEYIGQNVLPKIYEYANNHFATEEKYFDEFNYEGTEEHKSEHSRFKQKLTEIADLYMTNKMEASFDLADFLEDWLLDHIANMDKKYVDCFHQHGLY